MSETVSAAAAGLKPGAEAVSDTASGPVCLLFRIPVTVNVALVRFSGNTMLAGRETMPDGVEARLTVRALVAGVLRVTAAVVLLPLEIVELASINESFAP